MGHIQNDQTIQKMASQAASESGKATTNPRAKLRPLLAGSSSSMSLTRDFLISLASWKAVKRLILSSLGRRKGRTPPDAGRRPACRQFATHITWLLGDIVVITRLAFDDLVPTKVVMARAIRIKPLAGQVRASPKYQRLMAILAFMLISRPALAQETDRVITPVEIFEPERGDGIRIAPSLSLFPALDADVTFDDNIYNTSQQTTDDIVASVRPRLTLRTDLPRHEFRLTGGADLRRYAKTEDENSEQFDIQSKAVIELAGRTNVVADAGFRRGIEQRGTAGDQFLTDRPVAYNRKYAGLLVRRQGGFVELLAEGRIAETDYRDTLANGLPVDLSARDVTVKRARIRASAPSSHYSRVFIEGSINSVSYEKSLSVKRNSDGYAVLGGMLLRLTDLVDLEVGAGYIHQSFDNPAIKNISAANFHLQVKWTPRADWQIVAAGSRQVEPSPRLDVPAIMRSTFSLEARKAISDRALVSAEVGIVDEKYRSSGREDRRFYAAAEAHYRLTDKVGLIGRASWRQQDANALGREYNGVSASLGVRFRF